MTHGMSQTRIYRIWTDMKSRCLSKTNKWYPLYGGRGITVCEEWKDFPTFYKWAIENGYSDDLTIDRIDNDKGYFPGNCRWATQHEQSMNKRHISGRTGYVGVRKHSKCNGYVAEVSRFRKNIYIGYFKTVEEAYVAREEFIRRNGL